jgi:FtsP/CotA-like multicopper oxidase with cupredoxin domain
MSGYWAAIALILGLLVPVLGGIAIWMGFSAHSARQDANRAVQAVGSGSAMPGMNMSGSGDLQSFAGQGPANAAALAAEHVPMNAALPPAPAGPVARVHLVLVDKTIEIAPGIKYSAWAFSGGAPAPFIHVRQGQRVELTLTNKGVIPHSVDFHAARIAPNVAFRDVQPGASIHYSFVANDPGAFMFHCGTKPVLAHIANGMYGAIIVEPRVPLPHADKNYVLVARRVVPQLRGFPQAGNAGHGEGAATGAGLGHLERLRGPVRLPSTDGRPRSDGPLLGRRRRAELRHRVSRRRNDSRPSVGQC